VGGGGWAALSHRNNVNITTLLRMTQKQRDKPGMPDSLVRDRHTALAGGLGVLKINWKRANL